MNDWLPIVPVMIAGLLTVLGWLAVNRLTERREKKNKARELRVQYLAKACRVLVRVALEGNAVATARELEEAIADVYLFGTKEQVVLARKFIDEFTSEQSADMHELLQSLLNVLKVELELPPVLERPTFLKLTPKSLGR